MPDFLEHEDDGEILTRIPMVSEDVDAMLEKLGLEWTKDRAKVTGWTISDKDSTA